MIDALVSLMPFALEGQWHGAAAVALVIVGLIIFVGTIYALLVAVYGWYQGYLVTMTAFMAFSIILSAMWLFGIPGTIPGTGPRGTEPYWVVFLADSEQGQDFAAEIKQFPKSPWREPSASEVYPGQINAEGELDSIRNVLRPALAGYFQKQKTGSSKPADYTFRIAGRTPVEEEKKLPAATVLFYPSGTVEKKDPESKKITQRFTPERPAKQLLVGIDLPAVPGPKGHPAIRIFGYRNKGRVFQASAEWLAISVVLFALHLGLLGRYEKREKARLAQAGSSVGSPQPANV